MNLSQSAGIRCFSSRIFFTVAIFMGIYSGLIFVHFECPFELGTAFAEEKAAEKKTVKGDIVAEINGSIITTGDLVNRYNLFLIMSRYPALYKKEIPIDSYADNFIAETLLLEEAEKNGIKVSPDLVEKEEKKYLSGNRATEEALLKDIRKAGLDRQDIYHYFERNLIISKLGQEKFGSENVSDETARKFYEQNSKYFNRPEKINVSHILICHRDSRDCSSDLSSEAAKELASNIRKLATPENFSRLAMRYSSNSTGKNGGDLGIITRGTAMPAFEDAAFRLKKGEISEVVETENGFHIIYVKDKQEALSQTFEEANDSIKETLMDNHIASGLFKLSKQLLKTADLKRYTVSDIKGILITESKQNNNSQDEEDSLPEIIFPTFKFTGRKISTNSDGQPVILFFSTPECPHCKWIEEIFHSTVEEYTGKGLIEAHHYDLHTQDDLLTPLKETKIPEEYFKIYKQGSKGYVPYFNFGQRYERISNGYELKGDLFSEEKEMHQVIDSLLQLK